MKFDQVTFAYESGENVLEEHFFRGLKGGNGSSSWAYWIWQSSIMNLLLGL